jgi:hypothetical protein
MREFSSMIPPCFAAGAHFLHIPAALLWHTTPNLMLFGYALIGDIKPLRKRQLTANGGQGRWLPAAA